MTFLKPFFVRQQEVLKMPFLEGIPKMSRELQ